MRRSKPRPAADVPELPEVEVVRRGLERHAQGRRVLSATVLHPRAVRRDPAGASGFAAALAGQRIEAVRRRGKYLWFALDSADALIAHLGMSGQFRVHPAADAPEHRHLRIRLGLDDDTVLDFLDQRTFGGLALDPVGADLPAPLAHIARDPLDPEFDLDSAVARLRAKRTELKRALLDQTVVSGIGNIYADEALWRSGFHGARPTQKLTRTQAKTVLQHASDVMTEALAVGGTSFDALYVNVNGESGYFSRELSAYGQADRPCPRCGTPIVREHFMNRSSFFCPKCQRKPRRPS